jgi:hypothetical protein
MIKEDIIRMAREAGWTQYSLLHPVELQRLERFASLVAAAEREACKRVMKQALDALENLGKHTSERECDEAIAALRAALRATLAQQAEPVVPKSDYRDWDYQDSLDKQAAPPQVVIHAKDCWSWGPQHYECACAEIAKLKGWGNGL